MRRWCGALASLTLAWGALAWAAGAADAAPKGDLDVMVRQAVETVLAQTGSPSASIAVVVKGRIVLAKGYGLARLKPPIPASDSTRYGIGSISKAFTAAAILILQSEGKLSLDDHVDRWFPDLTKADSISLRQILSHTAGYQDYYAEDYTLTPMQQPTTPEAIMDGWAKKTLDFDPGTDWQYSNTGYVIAGRIVEKVSGLSLFEFLKRRIFAPLHMQSPLDNDAKRISAPDAVGYVRAALGPVRPVIPEGSGWMYGAGELAMTAEDVAKWDISLIDRSLLTPQAYKDEVRTVPLIDGKDTGYAMGLFVSKTAERVSYEHSGEVAGFVSENRIYPDDGVAIVVLTNIQAGGASQIAQSIADLILPADPIDARVKQVFLDLQAGRVDHSLLAPNLNSYFTPRTVKDFKSSLGPLAAPLRFELRRVSDRGGMKFRRYKVVFATKSVDLSVYVMPDGHLEQFLVSSEE